MSNTDENIRQIDEVGYCKIPKVFDSSEMSRALELVRHWHQKTTDSLAENVPFLNRNQPMVYNLQNKDFYFLKLLFSPTVIEQIFAHFLNDQWFKQIPEGAPNYILRSYLGRSSKAALPMHIDSFVPYLGDHVTIMQMIIVLEDMNEANGCTIVVPGSHKSGVYTTPEASQGALPVEAESGDVVIWDSRLWHGTTENPTDSTRWAIIGTFSRWWIKQAFDIPRVLPQEIYNQLSDREKAILGFCSVPFDTEREGIDMKRGYEGLRKRQSPMGV